MLNFNIQNWILHPLYGKEAKWSLQLKLVHICHTCFLCDKERFENVGTAGDWKKQCILKAVLDSAILCPEQQCINGVTNFGVFCV